PCGWGAGDWERFRTVWHARRGDDGDMVPGGPAERFIAVTKESWAKGVFILRYFGGSAIDVAGDRAVAQTKITTSQRAPVDGVLCYVVCTRALLRLLGAVGRLLGDRAAPADLREGP